MSSRRLSCPSLVILCLANVSMLLASDNTCNKRDIEEPSLRSALALLERHAAEAEQDLLDLAAIPSISSMEDYHPHVLDAGKWLVRRLRRAGLKVLFTEL